MKFGDPVVDELRVAALPLDNVVIAFRSYVINIGVVSPIGLVSLIFLFDGRNVRFVILFHVTN